MAGSRKWFVYTTDAGIDFALNLDESNTEAINGGTQDFPDGGTVVYALPRNVKPRVANFRSLDGTVQRRVVCLTQTIYNSLNSGTTISVPSNGPGIPTNLFLSNTQGERIRRPFGLDTGLTDGDPS